MGWAVQGTRADRSLGPRLARLAPHLLPLAIVAVLVSGALVLAYMPAAERQPPAQDATDGRSPPAADAHLAAVRDALQRGELGTAQAAWRDAYRALRRSRDWQQMAALGDLALELASAAGTPRAGDADARRAYLGALFRARADASVDGVLRATEAFATLGDRDVVDEGLRTAQSLVGRTRDPGARERIAAARARLAGQAVDSDRAERPSGRITWDAGP
jgi:hypothetical protein